MNEQDDIKMVGAGYTLMGSRPKSTSNTPSGNSYQRYGLKRRERHKAPEGSIAAALPGVARDVGTNLARGVYGLAGSIYQIGNVATGGALDHALEGITGKSGTQRYAETDRYFAAKQTPELQAMERKLENSEGITESARQIVTNPRLAGAALVRAIPQVLGTGATAATTGARVTAKLASQGTARQSVKRTALDARDRAAVGTQGALTGGGSAQQAKQTIMDMSEGELVESPRYQEMLGRGLQPADARRVLADEASRWSAGTGALLGGAGGRGRTDAVPSLINRLKSDVLGFNPA